MTPRLLVAAVAVVFCSAVTANAQAAKKPAGKARAPVIFAVLFGGKTLEPVARIQKGRLAAIEVSGVRQKTFALQYYKPKTNYRLIFGGADAGTVSVAKAAYPGECAGNSAESTSSSKAVRLSGSLFALATGDSVKLPDAGYRRRPTAAERSIVEDLVRTEMSKQKVSAAALKVLRSQNLTALDVDADGVPEFVGSYWVSPSDKERDLLFFIARKANAADYGLAYSEFSKVTPGEIMNGDLSAMDDGTGHELLLDVLDYDGDGTAEIFTIGKAFEGNNFYVYKASGDVWKRVFETYNYRCAF